MTSTSNSSTAGTNNNANNNNNNININNNPSSNSNLDDIPKPLTKLIRLTMRGFYNIEQKLVIDMLARRKETKEDDLVEVLKFERKHLRSLILQMKQDKFINMRLIMETDEDGKSTRRNYYSINYRMFVNVVKYKIDHMRRKLETEERDLTSRASFICQSCCKTFTDLEVGQIFDPSRGQFRCTYCDGVVDEDPSVRPQADSRLVMANFNQQMEPIYALLQETENINWAINDFDRNNMTVTGGNTQAGVGMSNGNSSSNIPNGTLSSDQQNQSSTSNNLNHQDNYPIRLIGQDEFKQDKKNLGLTINSEIEALLLREETLNNNNTNNNNNPLNSLSNAQAQDNNISHDEDEVMDGVTDAIIMVNVGQTRVPLGKISDEHVALMSQQQKVDYTRLIQHIHNLMFD